MPYEERLSSNIFQLLLFLIDPAPLISRYKKYCPAILRGLPEFSDGLVTSNEELKILNPDFKKLIYIN